MGQFWQPHHTIASRWYNLDVVEGYTVRNKNNIATHCLLLVEYFSNIKLRIIIFIV